ncbi:MAG: hypothetical protein AAGF25_12360 [Pseudomonadota bacterium]
MATNDEVHYTAAMLSKIMKSMYGEYGGIVGVLDFRCSVVRHLEHEDGGRLACVLETPLDAIECGGYRRPSHADIVYAREHCQDEQATRVKIFNAIAIAGNQPFTRLEDVDGGQLSEYLPDALKGS